MATDPLTITEVANLVFYQDFVYYLSLWHDLISDMYITTILLLCLLYVCVCVCFSSYTSIISQFMAYNL